MARSPRPIRVAFVVLASVAWMVLSGCERKETLVDIETPAGEVEVERSVESGRVDVEVRGEGVDESAGDDF